MAEEITRYTGLVSRFNDLKGFGFIKPDDGIVDGDLFVHHSDIKAEGYRTLKEGQLVEFVVVKEGDKTKAVDVTGPNGVAIQGGGGRSERDGGYSRRNGNAGDGGRNCYICGEIGHLARDCAGGHGSNGGGSRGGDGCYTCGDIGHIARDCDKSGVRVALVQCFNCGGVGHIARECPSSPRDGGGRNGGGRPRGCYTCGLEGHLARDCSQAGGNLRSGGGGGCYTCGLEGHLARECSQAGGNSRSGGGGGGCYTCGKAGHFARECTEAR